MDLATSIIQFLETDTVLYYSEVLFENFYLCCLGSKNKNNYFYRNLLNYCIYKKIGGHL